MQKTPKLLLFVTLGASRVALVVRNSPANAGNVRDLGLIPGVEKIPWRRKWHPTPVFSPGESCGPRATVHGVTKSWTSLKQLSMRALRYTSVCGSQDGLTLVRDRWTDGQMDRWNGMQSPQTALRIHRNSVHSRESRGQDRLPRKCWEFQSMWKTE